MKSLIDDKNSKNATATLVRRLRIELGMTQQQLADRAGVSFSFVNQVERGKQTVRLDALNKILRVFGYTMAPSRNFGAFAAESAWSGIKIETFEASVPEGGAPVAPTSSPEPGPAPIRQNNDWAFYK